MRDAASKIIGGILPESIYVARNVILYFTDIKTALSDIIIDERELRRKLIMLTSGQAYAASSGDGKRAEMLRRRRRISLRQADLILRREQFQEYSSRRQPHYWPIGVWAK